MWPTPRQAPPNPLLQTAPTEGSKNCPIVLDDPRDGIAPPTVDPTAPDAGRPDEGLNGVAGEGTVDAEPTPLAGPREAAPLPSGDNTSADTSSSVASGDGCFTPQAQIRSGPPPAERAMDALPSPTPPPPPPAPPRRPQDTPPPPKGPYPGRPRQGGGRPSAHGPRGTLPCREPAWGGAQTALRAITAQAENAHTNDFLPSKSAPTCPVVKHPTQQTKYQWYRIRCPHLHHETRHHTVAMMSVRLCGTDVSSTGYQDKCYCQLLERHHGPMIKRIQKMIKKVSKSAGFRS